MRAPHTQSGTHGADSVLECVPASIALLSVIHKGLLCAGHGGPGAAAFVNENLLNTLLSHEKFDSDLKTALSEHI